MKILHVTGTYPTKEEPFRQPFIKAQINSLKKMGVKVVVLNVKGNLSKLNYLRSAKTINKLLEEHKFDLIHTHYSFCMIPVILSKSKLPVVLSLMGSDLLGIPNYKGKSTIKGFLSKFITKILYRRANHIIVKSEEMKRKLHCENVTVIPNGVDFETFLPLDIKSIRDELDLPLEKFIVLFLGDPYSNRKNMKLAKESFEIINKKYNDCLFINPYGSSHNLIPKFLNAANVLLLTSYWEGSPNVIKEAMACNMPIISTDVGDVSEIISGTNNCFITEFNKYDIAKKLEKVYYNRTKTNGRLKIRTLDEKVIAERIINLYRKILASTEHKNEFPIYKINSELDEIKK